MFRELEMCEDAVPSSHFSNVKSFLMTGLLDGLDVWYISRKPKVELHGVIKGGGYLCSCSSCKYSEVLTANEFERHAGVSSSHPNNHIILPNGRTLHEVVKQIAKIPLRCSSEAIQGVIGCPLNWKLYYEVLRKGSSQTASHELQQDRVDSDISQEYKPKLFNSFDSYGRFQKEGPWMAKGAVCLTMATNDNLPFGTSSRIEPKRVHQWISDGLDSEDSSSNKKQAVEASNDGSILENSDGCRSIPNQLVDDGSRSESSSICTRTNPFQHTNNGELNLNCSPIKDEESASSSGNGEIKGNVTDSIAQTPEELERKEGVSGTEDSSNCTPNDSSNCTPNENLELKIYKKVLPTSPLSNVKGLLSTGLLEGFPVKYKKSEVELPGYIKDLGYQCGCSSCKYTKVLSALEFERHASVSSKNQNNHIFLENGKTLFVLVKELLNVPLNSLDKVIEEKIGSPANLKRYEVWKESFHTANHECQKISINDEKNQQTQSELHSKPHSIISFPVPATEDTDYQASISRMQDVSIEKNCPEMQNKSQREKLLVKIFPVPATEDTDCQASISRMQDVSIEKKFPEMQNKSGREKLLVKIPRSSSPDLSYLPESTVYPVQQKTNVQGGPKKRGNDLHRLIFMENGLPDGCELAYIIKGKKLLTGYKFGNGIVCCCCNSEVSPSQFEAHAGYGKRRQPYRHIYTSNGLSLHELSLSLSKGQNLTVICSDDLCTSCGEGGELVFCNGCPKAFHTACLELQCLPDDEWYCPNCKDSFGSGTASRETSSSDVKPITLRIRRVFKAPKDDDGCVICKSCHFSLGTFNRETVMICEQCEKEYHVGCLKDHGICDLEELPIGNWFCCADCVSVNSALQNLVFKGAEIIPESVFCIIKRKIEGKDLTNEDGDDVQWQLLSGKFQSSENKLLFSKVAAVFQDSFDPITRSGHDLIPAMVYGKNVAGQDFGGMYCAILTVKSVVVSAGILRILGTGIAELPLIATAKESQGKGYFQSLFLMIERLLSQLNVKILILPAAEDAQSSWTNKLGFVKVTEERLQKYIQEFRVMRFHKTVMLEKSVPRFEAELAVAEVYTGVPSNEVP